ncbi:MAG: helix-turn-helix domain-containing protein [Candidatus Tectomicrobia bacterium]|nr:helix-turn-helix domain-containing protein [Candidatus Tectomicrobia bacterium]
MAHAEAQVIISPVEPVLTTKQVGAILQIHQRSVERLIAAGKLEALTIGRRWRVTATQLQTFITRQSPSPQPVTSAPSM